VKNHVFQATLAETVDGHGGPNLWFLQTYYAALGGNGDFNEANNKNGQTCKQAQVTQCLVILDETFLGKMCFSYS